MKISLKATWPRKQRKRMQVPLRRHIGLLLLVLCVESGLLLLTLHHGNLHRWYFPITFGGIFATMALVIRWSVSQNGGRWQPGAKRPSA